MITSRYFGYLALLTAASIIAGCAGPPIGRTQPGPADANVAAEYSTTQSGLQYRILRQSQGRRPAATDNVTVYYKGSLDNGQIFDSSYQRGKTATFRLNEVVAGWTEGLQLVGEGGMIELRIPPELGYGAKGKPPVIPGGSSLNFIVELEKIEG
jgi:FKBP-type peptidyl-prolyl cis-trans isomerase FkpA